MSTSVSSNQEFQSDGRADVISLVVTGSSGSATLQKEGGGSWVNVSDGAITNSGELTFWAPKGQTYRVTLTGDCEAFVTI